MPTRSPQEKDTPFPCKHLTSAINFALAEFEGMAKGVPSTFISHTRVYLEQC